MAKKERNLKNKFSYDGNNSDYNFQLKKRPNLWWLLLLLLPLVLLIPLKKDITVYTKSGGNPEPYVDVSMNYTARYLLWNKKFMVKMPYDTIQQTDSEGRTVFKKLGYSVYSLVFHFRNPIVFRAGGSDCYEPIERSCWFHTKRRVVLDMEPKMADVTLKVVDKELRFEIPGAKVECQYEGRNGTQHTSDETDATGCVMLKDAKKCGECNSIKVSAEGYADTLLTNIKVEEMLQGYVIPLRPLKERFIFYVKNVYNKEPIPNALAEVTLTLNGQAGSASKTPTNVDGLGQGFFDDARILATIGIKASKDGYYDSVYVAPQGKPNPITVKEFVKLADDDRIVWLRPKPQTVQFRNVDTISGDPIAGVRNEIVIVGVDGKTRGPKVEISNRNGYFPVTALPGDKITINSTLDPNYYPKTTVIDSFENKEETVYMRPVLVDLAFRTLEMSGNTIGEELPDCDLVVTVDGKRVDPTNSGTGTFTVPQLRLSSDISIVASKEYYETNDTKVRHRNVGYLYNASQDERDIPLKIERECGDYYTSKIFDQSIRIVIIPHFIGQSFGKFKFMFRTRNVGDEIEVWNCKASEIKEENRQKYCLFRWTLQDGANGDGCTPPGPVNSNSNETMPGFSPETRWLTFNNGPYITVVGYRNPNSDNTNFDYMLFCPDEDGEWKWVNDE